MYESFFNFNQLPFENTPDPTFFYGSEQHREALAALVYGIRQFKGFMLITGDVGTGKTLLAQSLKHEMDNSEDISKTVIIQISNPWISHGELFDELAFRLGIKDQEGSGSTIEVQKVIQEELLKVYESKGRVILILDEAQQIPEKTLEGVRLLSNMEVPHAKLIQIILLGQTEFNDILTRHSMRQLRQRITLSRRLEPLSLDDTIGYIDHRVHIAGADSTPFTRSAIHAIYEASGGSPRLINQICDNALITAYASKNEKIDKLVIAEVVADLPIVISSKAEQAQKSQAAQEESSEKAPQKPETLLQRLASERGLNNSNEQEENKTRNKSSTSNTTKTPDLNYLAQQALLNAMNDSLNAQVSAVKHSHDRSFVKQPPQWLIYSLVSLISVLIGLGATFAYIESKSSSDKTMAAPPAKEAQQPVTAPQNENPATGMEMQKPMAQAEEMAQTDKGYQRVYQDPIERFKDLDSPRAFKETFDSEQPVDLSDTKVEEIRKRWGFDTETSQTMRQPMSDLPSQIDPYEAQNMPAPQPLQNTRPIVVNPGAVKLESPVETLMKMDQPFLPLEYGSTVSQVARSKYTTWNDTVQDIVILANPTLKGDLSAGRANQRIYLPNFYKDDLLTRGGDGRWYIYAGTYNARSRADKVIANLASIGLNSFSLEQARYQDTIHRAFIGPFNSIRDASMATDNLRLDAMPFVR